MGLGTQLRDREVSPSLCQTLCSCHLRRRLRVGGGERRRDGKNRIKRLKRVKVGKMFQTLSSKQLAPGGSQVSKTDLQTAAHSKILNFCSSLLCSLRAGGQGLQGEPPRLVQGVPEIWGGGWLHACQAIILPTELYPQDPRYYNFKGSSLKQNILLPFKSLDQLNYDSLIGREPVVSGSDKGLLPPKDHYTQAEAILCGGMIQRGSTSR